MASVGQQEAGTEHDIDPDECLYWSEVVWVKDLDNNITL